MSEGRLIKLRRLQRLRLRNVTVNVTCILLAGSCIVWVVNYFWRYANYEITNDAMVEQYITPLNIRAAGYVKESPLHRTPVCTHRRHPFGSG